MALTAGLPDLRQFDLMPVAQLILNADGYTATGDLLGKVSLDH
jgi:hypothetical protein